MARLWRLYQPDLPHREGVVVSVGAEESHHAKRVLRLREGDAVALFDGAGREWLARVVAFEEQRASVRLEREILEPEVEAPLEVTVYQALLRPERMEWVVQKCTELGVAAIHPFASDRAEPRPPDRRRVDRWQRIAVEACKQSGRRRLPRLAPLPRLPAPAGGGGMAILLQPDTRSRSLSGLQTESGPKSLEIAVGPQAGFTDEEVEFHARAGWLPVGLGPRTLRADTAGVIAAAIALHRWGDLGREPRVRGSV